NGGRSIKIAGGVGDHTCLRQTAVRSARKAVQHSLMSARIDFEYDATATKANRIVFDTTVHRGPVEISGPLANNARSQSASGGSAGEALGGRNRPAGSRLVSAAARPAAPKGSGAVQVPPRVADPAAHRFGAIKPAGEPIQHRLLASGIQPIHDPAANIQTIG